jgi:hypothetical protein
MWHEGTGHRGGLQLNFMRFRVQISAQWLDNIFLTRPPTRPLPDKCLDGTSNYTTTHPTAFLPIHYSIIFLLIDVILIVSKVP